MSFWATAASTNKPKSKLGLNAIRAGHFIFILASDSWLNAVEGFSARLTGQRFKHAVFHAGANLQAAINRFIIEHDATEAKPFTWRAAPDLSIVARNRGFQTLEPVH